MNDIWSYPPLPEEMSVKWSRELMTDLIFILVVGKAIKLLSKADKLVLVKAVAQAIPTYTMGVFRLPKGICKIFISKVEVLVGQ